MSGNSADKILIEGESCWRRVRARRAALLIDGASYYGVLRQALRAARRSVFIVGWDIDSRTRLVGASGEPDDGLPDRLGPFLTELVSRRPELRVHLLLWDYSMLYALDREPLPSVNLAWTTPKQISVCLDDVLPVGASHHQKIVVVDDSLAFAGGFDLTIRRWDTSGHEMGDARRADPGGETYRPFHDVQMMVDGDAAAAMGELVRERWHRAACETPRAVTPSGDPWPDAVEPDFRDVPVGIARTMPAYDSDDAIREVETMYRRTIAAAERSIYIENQYLTASSVAESLVARLKDNPELEVLFVGPNVHQSWLEEHSMNAGRRRFMDRLCAAGMRDRVRLVHPAIPDDDTGEGTMVHAKLAIIDDRVLRVGSANLNNRSMGMDTECDLALEAETPAHRQTIARLRNRLLAEHLGTKPDIVGREIEGTGSVLAAVEKLSGGARTLRPIDLDGVPDDEIVRSVSQLADPEKPIATPTFAGDLFGGSAAPEGPRRLVRLIALACLVLGLVAAWRFVPPSGLTDPAELVRWLEHLDRELWMPIVVPAVFVLGGLVAFPVTVLIAGMGMMFSPPAAFAYSLAGSLLSAAATFWIGHSIGRGRLRDLAGRSVNRISRSLARRGVLSVAALRMVPIAPFTLINLVAGASHIRAVDFLLGTLLGMAPGILIISVLGHQLGRVLRDPSMSGILLFALGLAVWVLLAVGLQRMAVWLRRRGNG